MVRRLETIDAHVGGQPLRLIVDGLPRLDGRAPDETAAWFGARADALRRALVLEPRGHHDMTAACLTEPAAPSSHAGLVFMDADGYPALLGHGVIAAVTIAIERGLIVAPEVDGRVALTLDTAAGPVRAVARLQAAGVGRRVAGVTFSGVPSFVREPGRTVTVSGRTLTVDVADAAGVFAITDSEAAGIPLDGAHLPELRRLGMALCEALAPASASDDAVDGASGAAGGVAAPTDATSFEASGAPAPPSGVVFVGASHHPEAHLRLVTVSRSGVVDRSATGAGLLAAVAVLDAMGLVPDGEPCVCEGLGGLRASGRVERRTAVGEAPAVVVAIDGTAWITGEHVFAIDETDPLGAGLRL